MSNFFKEINNKHLTPHVRISNDIREAITSGELKPGELLLPERKIAESYNVTYSSVRKATQTLVEEGLLFKHRGKGILIRKTGSAEESNKIEKIGLLLNDISWQEPHNAARIDTISKSLAMRGIELTLASSDNGTIPESLLTEGIKGVILLGKSLRSQISKFDSLKIPTVFVGYPLGSIFKYVDFDEYATGFLAAETLIKKGHKKIVYIGRDDGKIIYHNLRQSGYRKALQEYDLMADHHIISIDLDNPTEKSRVIEKLKRISPTSLIISSRSYETLMNDIFFENKIQILDNLSVISLGSIAVNMPPTSKFSFDAVGCRYTDVAEQAINILIEDIMTGGKYEKIISGYLLKPIYLERGSVKEIK